MLKEEERGQGLRWRKWRGEKRRRFKSEGEVKGKWEKRDVGLEGRVKE